MTRASLALLEVAVLALAVGVAAEGVEELRAGAPVERAIGPGETHAFRLPPTAGRWWVGVEALGVDVRLAWVDAGGGRRLAVNSPGGQYAVEALLTPSGDGGVLEVSSPPHRAPGRYRLAAEAHAEAVPSLAAEEATTRAGVLYAEDDSEARRRALDAYREAVELWSRTGSRRERARALFRLGALERQLGEAAAAEHLGRSLELWRELGDRRAEAAAHNELGELRRRRGEFPAALAAYRRALELRRGIEDRHGEAQTLSNLGLTHVERGEPRLALELLAQALDVARAAGDDELAARVETNLGGAHYRLGEIDEAIAAFSRALETYRRTGAEGQTARQLVTLGAVHRRLGEYGRALAHYLEALPILERRGDVRGEASARNNAGVAYLMLGEPERALGILRRALDLRRRVGDRPGEVVTLINLGLALERLERTRLAVDRFRRAADLARELGDAGSQATALAYLGSAEGGLAAPEALEALSRARELARTVADPSVEARVLRRQGEALLERGEIGGARAALERAVELYGALAEPAGEAVALSALAVAERRAGSLEAAQRRLEAAIARIEAQRAAIGDLDLRASFLAAQRRAYAELIDLEMELHRRRPREGHDLRAFATSERFRARSLLDLLAEADAEPAAGDPELAARQQTLRRRLSLAAAERTRARRRGHDATAAEARVEEVLSELEVVEGELRGRAGGEGAGLAPRTLTVAEIQALLDGDTLLVEYALGEERSFLWALTRDAVVSRELAGRDRIEAAARRVYEEWRVYDPGRAAGGRDGAAELSRLVLAPIAPALAGRRLVVVADGVLHYVPFAALPAPASGEPLLTRHEVVHLPSASVLDELRRGDRASGEMAILADPVFGAGDPRLEGAPAAGAALEPLPRLPWSGREAEAIAALVPPGRLLSARGFAARRELVLRGELDRYRFVHFATHGVLDSRHPELSALVLSRFDPEGRPIDGLLRLGDVYGLRLAAELVVLSGCETALGREIHGEGLVGLTRGFLHAGAERVMASLWRVRDEATAELMASFYRALLGEGLRPAAALRQAQLEIRTRRRWRDPHFWAAFVVQGRP